MKTFDRQTRCIHFALAGFLLLGSALPLAASAQSVSEQSPGAASVSAVVSIGTTVADLDRSVAFFTDVLDFQLVRETESAGTELEKLTGVFGSRCRTARLKLGEEALDLTQYLAPEGRPVPADSRSNDRWFQHIAIVVSDIDKAYTKLRQHHVRHASTGPQVLPSWNTNAGGIAAFYFKDPDGHVLEIIHFPPGKGEERWQAPTDRLFLGIDHTAIVVANTERSVGFYRDRLGLRVAGESDNYGTEQEHLNNVFGARLRITALRAQAGPGIELLEYLAPIDGRDMPVDTRANDLWHWHVSLLASDVQALETLFKATRGRWISPELVTGTQTLSDFATGSQAWDPDGHALILGVAGKNSSDASTSR